MAAASPSPCHSGPLRVEGQPQFQLGACEESDADPPERNEAA